MKEDGEKDKMKENERKEDEENNDGMKEDGKKREGRKEDREKEDGGEDGRNKDREEDGKKEDGGEDGRKEDGGEDGRKEDGGYLEGVDRNCLIGVVLQRSQVEGEGAELKRSISQIEQLPIQPLFQFQHFNCCHQRTVHVICNLHSWWINVGRRWKKKECRRGGGRETLNDKRTPWSSTVLRKVKLERRPTSVF